MKRIPKIREVTIMTNIDEKLNELFRDLVPNVGKADTLAGEIIRAITRIGYRWYNDGDMINKGYGKETCNAAARFLMYNTNETIREYIADIADTQCFPSDIYEDRLHELKIEVLKYIEQHPETREQETEDMFQYSEPEDYDEEDDDWCEDCEDYEDEDEDDDY